MSSSTPRFSLDDPKHDLTSYFGRWAHFMDMVNPRSLFTTEAELKKSQELLCQYRQGTLSKGAVSDQELWNARKIQESMVHPQTGEVLPIFFRLCSFVPVNIPICAGMILAPPTLGNTIFWQWVNQSYNAGFNYENRNASSSQETSSILKAYCSATIISCLTAVGLGKAVQSASSLNPSFRSLIQRTVPFIAVASSGAFNAVFMRINELQEGIDIVDEDGVIRGKSIAAGKKSLTEVALTRVAIPMPVLLLPPYLMEAMKRVNMMPKNKFGKVIAELGVITLCLWGAFPAAIAIFPQNGTISSNHVEKEFQNLTTENGYKVKQFSYNKGI